MKVGIQTYSVKNALSQDPSGTFKKVAAMGYRYWETATSKAFDDERAFGLGLSVKDARAMLDDYGVKVVGAHFFPPRYDRYEAFLEYQAAIGNPAVGPSADFFDNYEDTLRKCELLNELALKAKAYGLVFYYHNHFHEFQKFNGQTVMDIIYENTDPTLVKIELDNYWSARGGVDPVEMIHRYGDRLIMMHQKDFAKDAGEPVDMFVNLVKPDQLITLDVHQKARHVGTFAEVGTGILDIQANINAGNAVGVSYILLEQDLTKLDEIESIQLSMKAFRKFTGIEWD